MSTQFTPANSCSFFERTDLPKEFWQDLAKLGPNPHGFKVHALIEKYVISGQLKSDHVKAIEKHSINKPVFVAQANHVPPAKVTKVAAIQLKKVRSDKVLTRKLDEFLHYSNGGFSNVVAKSEFMPGWLMEKMHFKPDHFTVRMDRGYRVLFRKLEDDSIEILDMGKHVNH